MSVKQSYDQWALQYDDSVNKTRDMEAIAIREILSGKQFSNCLEIGCGTGKNSDFLTGICGHVTALDISEEMLMKAKAKIAAENIEFLQYDVQGYWNFKHSPFQLITCSLVLEHIEQLDLLFKNASANLLKGGLLYAGELHPFKQYMGSKARFDEADRVHVVECYIHHFSDFVSAGMENGLRVVQVKEYFDDEVQIPRILALLLEKV